MLKSIRTKVHVRVPVIESHISGGWFLFGHTACIILEKHLGSPTDNFTPFSFSHQTKMKLFLLGTLGLLSVALLASAQAQVYQPYMLYQPGYTGGYGYGGFGGGSVGGIGGGGGGGFGGLFSMLIFRK